MSQQAQLPGWLRPANRAIIFLQRRGLALGTMHLISVPGRRTGKVRTTPVSPLTVHGARHVIGGFGDEADWVKNARAAGWGILARGNKRERVRLVDLPVEERVAVLREFPRQVPHGVPMFARLYGVTGDPDEFAALAPRCPVFRIEPEAT